MSHVCHWLRQCGITSRSVHTRRKFLIAGGCLVGGLPLAALGRVAWAASGDQTQRRPGLAANDLVDGDLRGRVKTLFEDVCNWTMTLGLGSGTLKVGQREPKTFIWVNGNLARVLLAGHKIFNRPDYLAESFRWFDHLADRQQRTTTSTGQEAGWWGDDCTPEGNIYLADTGTAMTAIALGHKLADRQRQKRYLAVMERFSRLVRFGCQEDPQGRDRQAATTWLVETGEDRGALGCGYYRGHLSTTPYTISTAITRIEFLCLLRSINRDAGLTPIIDEAVRWILAKRLPSGEFPYLIDGLDPRQFHWPLDTMTYCGEGLVAAYLYRDDPELRRHVARGVRPCVDWLVRTQNDDGSWGKMGSQDQQRSPGCVTLLAWYYRTVDADPQVAKSVHKYCRFLLDPANHGPYGYKRLVRTTGFIGLVLAELLKPDVVFA